MDSFFSDFSKILGCCSRTTSIDDNLMRSGQSGQQMENTNGSIVESVTGGHEMPLCRQMSGVSVNSKTADSGDNLIDNVPSVGVECKADQAVFNYDHLGQLAKLVSKKLGKKKHFFLCLSTGSF